MQTDAIYRDGVFRPLTPVVLRENQRVALDIKPLEEDPMVWLEKATKHREEMAAKYGLMPDSALEIAEDRTR